MATIKYIWKVWADNTDYTEEAPWVCEQLAAPIESIVSEKFAKMFCRIRGYWKEDTIVFVKDWNNNITKFRVFFVMEPVYYARRIQ